MAIITDVWVLHTTSREMERADTQSDFFFEITSGGQQAWPQTSWFSSGADDENARPSRSINL